MLGAMARIAQARGDGVHCPSTARHAAFNDQMFAGLLSYRNFCPSKNLRWGKLAVTITTTQIPEIFIQPTGMIGN